MKHLVTAFPQAEFSDEAQDIAHYAHKAAQKNNGGVVMDRHVLWGLLRIDRMFTRLNALLKQAGTTPQRLKKAYLQIETSPSAFNQSQTVWQEAVLLAQTAAGAGKKPRVEVEHVLLALFGSPDPVVQQTFEAGGLTIAAVREALPKVQAKSPVRMVLYCLRETIEVIVVVLTLLIIIKQGLGEPRLIPSESMVPTLQVGDRIIVEKLSRWVRHPQRGDILVFYPPAPQAILRYDPLSALLRWTGFSGLIYDKDSRIDTAFIKRLIGLPGDIVDVRPNDGVYINGRKLDEPYVNEIAQTCTFITYCGPIKVPPHMFYMMGDNRNHSADSRYWQFLPDDRVIGRTVFRFFPLDSRFGTFTPPPYQAK